MKRTVFLYSIVDIRHVPARGVESGDFKGDAVKTFIHLHAGKSPIAPEERAEGLLKRRLSPAVGQDAGGAIVMGIGGEEDALDLAFLTERQPNISMDRFKSVKVTVELSEDAVEEETATNNPAMAIIQALMGGGGGRGMALASLMSSIGRRSAPEGRREHDGPEVHDPRDPRDRDPR